jgi:hypothetical protein
VSIFLPISCFINSTEECGRSFVFRRNGTRYAPNHTKKIKRSGRKSVPVWAWHSFDGAGKIHRIDGRLTSQQYIRILEDVLLPSAWARFGTDELIPFVQDCSTIHTSNMVMDWFNDEGVSFELLPWPPKGADMNPIENVWAEMVRDMDCQHGNVADLWDSVSTIWNNLSNRPNYWQILTNSMSKRLQMVVDVQGDWTKY